MRRPLVDSVRHPTWRQRLLHAYKKWITPESARSARLVLTVSQFSRRSLAEDFGIPEDRIRVIPEGVDATAFTRPEGFSSRPRSAYRILVQGAVDPRKNLSVVFTCAANLRRAGVDFRLCILGAPKTEFERAGYVLEAEKAGVGDRVDWPGCVDPTHLPRWYWDSDLFLYPSLWEGFGLPVLEAFAAGTPVVASDQSAIPEVAGDAARLVNPRDPQAMARVVREVLTHTATQHSLVARGLKRAQLFTWEATAELTAAAYREAAGVRP